MGASWADSKSKKSSFWSVVFSYSTQQQTISRSDCDVWWKVGFIDNKRRPAQWLDREEASKHFPKPNLHQEKVMVSVWWSVAGLTHYSFLGKPLHLSSMLSKLRHTKNCSAYSWHWSTERAQFFSTVMPGHTLHNQCFKSWTNWAMKFCFTSYVYLTSC